MTEDQEYLWHIELNSLRAQVRYALDNFNDLPYMPLYKRNEVKSKLENVYFTLDELCEQTKGETT